MFKHILLATDGSAASAQATAKAVDLANAVHARLTAVFVVDPYPYLGIGEANPMGLHAYLSAARDQAAAAHAKVLEACKERAPTLEPALTLIEDATATKGILATARELGADLIVVGSHGRTGLDKMLLGSVAAKIATLATVPVLIVH